MIVEKYYRTLGGTLLAAGIILAGLLNVSTRAEAQSARPNIVVMMADNLGYGDVGAYGGSRAPTPRIDALAREGIQLADFQVEPNCTPSRAAFLTGRLPIRSGTSGLAAPGTKTGLAPGEITLAELLREAGYSTALFGKWHLGESLERQPQFQGFDEFWGILTLITPASAEIPGYHPKFIRHQDVLQARRDQKPIITGKLSMEYRAEIDRDMTIKAKDYIAAQARTDKPFFLFVSFTNPHHPVLPHPDFKGKSGGGAYADVLMELDYNSGVILDTIDKQGLRDNTIVVWISDNGPTTYSEPYQNGDSGPWSGELGSAWEGGLRTAGMIRWPEKIESGRLSADLFHILDFFPTIATFAQATIPNDRPIDGLDQSDFLLGKQATSNRDHTIVFYNQKLTAVRWHQYKFLKVAHEKEHSILYPPTELPLPQIFNLRMDPKERHNLLGMKGYAPLLRQYYGLVGRYMQTLKAKNGRTGKKIRD